MRDKMRKNYQHKFNRIMRELNRLLEEDELWRGRFVFLQRDAQWWRFEDNSGGELVVFVRGYDKKTGCYHDYRLEYAPWRSTFYWHLNMETVNRFIVEDLKVWEEDPRPSIYSAEDFTKVKPNVEKVMSYDWNFYESRKVECL